MWRELLEPLRLNHGNISHIRFTVACLDHFVENHPGGCLLE